MAASVRPISAARATEMTVAAIVHPDTLEGLRQAAGLSIRIVHCSDLSSVSRLLEGDAEVLVAEPCGDIAALGSVLRSVRLIRPSAAIAIYCRLDSASVRSIVELVKAGASDVILRGFDDPAIWFRKRYEEWRHRTVPTRIIDLLPSWLPRALVPIVTYCLVHAHEAPCVAQVARAFGVHRRTLVNRLSAVRMPAPRRIISWCRLLVALNQIEHCGRSVEYVAHTMRFGSAAALTKMCVRYTGMTFGQLRAAGGVETAMNAFLAFLGSGRDIARAGTVKPTLVGFLTEADALDSPRRRPPYRAAQLRQASVRSVSKRIP